MPPVTGNDGTPSGFNPNAPFGVWGDSGSAGPFGPGGNGVVGSSGLSSGVAGFTLANQNRASGVFGIGPVVGVTGYVNGANTAPGGRSPSTEPARTGRTWAARAWSGRVTPVWAWWAT